ncbi:MAG: hypothetical protein V1838_04860 [Patescibacteria group bacterium]
MNKVLKKWWFWVTIVLAVVFFIPKPCGQTGGGYMGPTEEYPYHTQDCTCLGIKRTSNKFIDAGNSRSCLGIPLSYKCYTYWFDDEGKQVIQGRSCSE